MSLLGARMKGRHGARASNIRTLTVIAAAVLNPGGGETHIKLACAASVDLAAAGAVVIREDRVRPGRRLTLIGTSDAATVTIKDTAIANAIRGTITTAGGDRALGNGDTLEIEQQNEGHWLEVGINDVN